MGVLLPQVENAQNLNPHFSFNIVIVFTVVQVSIKYHDSSIFHYHQAIIITSKNLIILQTYTVGACSKYAN